MTANASAVLMAADHFFRVSESERGERARRAAAGALVLRALDASGDEFLMRRAGAEVAGLPRSAERSILERLLSLAGSGTAPERVARALVQFACVLERTRRLPEADAAATVAASFDRESAAAALHAARIARKLGARERALALYCTARDLDGSDGKVARLAEVGEAAVALDPEPALGRAIRGALRAGDAEAAAIGLEERAAVRRAGGERMAAARDLVIAGARYTDGLDRARVAHALASLLLTGGDVEGAREALLVALEQGERAQQDHARSRLHTLARDLRDQVGMRRWRSFKPAPLVSLSAYRAGAPRRSAARRLRPWREAIAS